MSACTACGERVDDDPDGTLVRCRACGARALKPQALTLALTVRSLNGLEEPGPVLNLDDQFRSRYRLHRVLGAGAMGMVLLADDLVRGRTVAVKFLTRTGDADFGARFARE